MRFTMDEASHILTREAARSDRKERLRQHAEHCILLAVVTTEPLAADLIDEAIVLRAENEVD